MKNLLKWKYLFVLSLIVTILSGEMFKGNISVTAIHAEAMLVMILSALIIVTINWNKI